MRNFLVSYRTVGNDGRSYGFGSSLAKLSEDEKLTPEVLDTICDEIKEANNLKDIVVLSFSEFDKEEA